METGQLRLYIPRFQARSDTKYRDIADGNWALQPAQFYSRAASDTKYRDIADGNLPDASYLLTYRDKSDTKYRDIADGNLRNLLENRAALLPLSDTKYRDIADGNQLEHRSIPAKLEVRYQVPRYSGWKHLWHAIPYNFLKKSQIPSTAI